MVQELKVAVIGGGYAGMAAAVELAARGVQVDVFEASRTLGGRARAVELREGVTADNGAHILVGAYRETLRLMRLVGADPEGLLQRMPLHLEYPGRFRLAAPTLPAPLHLAWALLAARGITLGEKLAAIAFMNALKASRFRLPEDTTVGELLDRHRQSSNLRRFLWEPLCVAALNTPAAQASAQVFANVLRDSLGAGRQASDLLLPRVDYSALFPEPAARYVESRGGWVRRGHRVQRLVRKGGGFAVDDFSGYDKAIIAVAPHHLSALLADWPSLAPLAEQVGALAYEPIVTVYLAYPESVSLTYPMLGLAEGWGQWVFDRGRLCGQAGLLAVVISAHGPHEAVDADTLADRVHAEVATLLPGLPPPRWSRVITEKRATFTCTANLRRPPGRTAEPGLFLAGDYVAGDYPATLEGAVRSGIAAAESALA